MKLQIFLLCCLSLRIQSQGLKPTRTYNGNQPESINFNNDDTPTNTYTRNADLQRENEYLQRNTQLRQVVGDDSYRRVQQARPTQQQSWQNQNQMNTPYGQFYGTQNQNVPPYSSYYPMSNDKLNQNANNRFQQPNQRISPPTSNSADYYGIPNFQQNQQHDANDGINRSGEVSPVPQAQRNETQDDLKTMTQATTYVGITMIKKAKESGSNVAVSPFSVVNMLALLQTGATGETQRQVTDALRLDPERSAAVFNIINTAFRKRGDDRNILKSASSIFAADGFELGTMFKNAAIQNFDSEVSSLSFANSAAAAQTINSWIERKTNNQIKELVKPESIDYNTKLVLANAIYFKGLWETIFKPEATRDKEFNLRNGQTKKVPFMSVRSGFRCAFDNSVNSLIAVLPFEGNQYSLVILLPHPVNGTVESLLDSLNGDKLAEYQKFRVKDTHMEIPKFNVRANTDLQPIFSELGIVKMFSPESELSRIGSYRSVAPQVSSAVHSAAMSIDERGATAAAASVVAVVALSYDVPSIVFKADRPFVAVLWENNLNVPLFMTKIEDPSM